MKQEPEDAQSPLSIQEALNELKTRWGYRNITHLLREWYKYRDEKWENYLCVLQTPESGPVYCRTEKRLYKELRTARMQNHPYEQCPAPDPTFSMWMVVGNFELEKEDED